jgi:hypothetical protein
MHLDRSYPPDTGANDFAYGAYTITIENNSVIMDYRDADYQDGNGSGGTDYQNPDLKIFYNHNDGHFYTDPGLTNRIDSYIAIWGQGNKSSGPRVPITVTNNFGEGEVKVGTSTVEAPCYQKWTVGEGDSIGAVSPQTINGLIYSFDSWSDDGAQTHVVTPALNDFGTFSFTASFDVAAPTQVTKFSIGGTIGDPVHLSWDVHTNSDVNYYIYRKVKHNGVMGQEEYVATVAHGTNSYDDDTWLLASNSVDLLFYDVRAHHIPSSTFAASHWEGAGYGEPNFKVLIDPDATASADRGSAADYSFTAHPNPFNPVTTMEFQLPTEGHVRLAVYDVLGRQVAELASGVHAAGIYSARWDASSVASGIYYARFVVTDDLGRVKYSKANKLLLMK